jgi:GntR family transcriptional repressor for pyruvate dehydrogenase complex
VVDHICILIENGTLRPGDSIPSKREVALTFMIGRAGLRTGINYLAAIGVMKVCTRFSITTIAVIYM